MSAHPDPCAACSFDVAGSIREAQAEADALPAAERERLRRDPLRDAEQALNSENPQTRAVAARWLLLERDSTIREELRLDAAEHALASDDGGLHAIAVRFLTRPAA